MEQLMQGYFRGKPVNELNKVQLKLAVLYVDLHIREEADSNKLVQYCSLKVDLINRLMVLEKKEHQKIL